MSETKLHRSLPIPVQSDAEAIAIAHVRAEVAADVEARQAAGGESSPGAAAGATVSGRLRQLACVLLARACAAPALAEAGPEDGSLARRLVRGMLPAPLAAAVEAAAVDATVFRNGADGALGPAQHALSLFDEDTEVSARRHRFPARAPPCVYLATKRN